MRLRRVTSMLAAVLAVAAIAAVTAYPLIIPAAARGDGTAPLSANSAQRPIHAADKSVARSASVGTWGDGAWCWFGDPRAVRVATPRDMTFVGWISRGGSVKVGAYDAATGAMRSTVVGAMFADDHSSPSILVEPDKRLTVFWSAHNGSSLYYRTSRQPESISGWGPVNAIAGNARGGLGFTYPNPVTLSAERDRLYLFWRGAAWASNYTTRGPAGHWRRAGDLIANPGQRPYLKVDSDGRDTIVFAFTDAHPRNALTSVYYMSYRSGWLRHTNGRAIARMDGRAISPRAADVVYNAHATGISSWVWDVALDRRRHPVIIYATFPSAEDHLYWYARWTGAAWVSHLLTHGGPTISPGTIEGEYSGGMALDHSTPSIVYLSRKVHGSFEIERWITPDGGAHWNHTTVARKPGADDLRPVVARGSDGGPMSLLWLSGHYGTYTSYATRVDFLR